MNSFPTTFIQWPSNSSLLSISEYLDFSCNIERLMPGIIAFLFIGSYSELGVYILVNQSWKRKLPLPLMKIHKTHHWQLLRNDEVVIDMQVVIESNRSQRLKHTKSVILDYENVIVPNLSNQRFQFNNVKIRSLFLTFKQLHA